MKTEEFYKKIQEKVGETEMEFEREFLFGKSSFQESPFGESQFLEWNKQDVWQRIEQKQTKRKKPFVWWQAVAASVVLLGGLGMYFYNNETAVTAHNEVIKEQIPTISTQPTLNPTTESTQLMANNGNHKNNVVRAMAMSKQQTTQPLETSPDNENGVTDEPTVAANETQNNVSSSETESNIAQQTPANDNYRFVPYQGFVEKRVAPQRRERVAILEIPDDEEDYNQAPRKEKKNGLVARLSRKLGKKGTEPNEELPAVNSGKPNKVWAFVKESFKNETMAADSTNR
ncbi:hypothetical protein GCM10011514_28130 [Emticicia aquatilis]|uniref:Uncharacterized protein n=1 Tax=Emticicia aquatilis TaxID=1537369 RepID=A0A916YUF6_9BACT|nr:hypothetical protein [Emticicia aquatilis]GGD62407.1 hypothetical protein GCM10011514_28130 [Emticicia aquatilis]